MKLGVYDAYQRVRFETAISTYGGGRTVQWVRHYFTNQSGPAIASGIAAMASLGYRIYLSFHPTTTWVNIANNAEDARWTSIGNSLAGVQASPYGPHIWTFNHEPENDLPSTNPGPVDATKGSLINANDFTAAFEHVAGVIRPLAGSNWLAAPCLMQFSFPRGGAGWSSWVDSWIPAGNSFDVLGIDYYCQRGASDNAGLHWAQNNTFVNSLLDVQELLTHSANRGGHPIIFPEFGMPIKDPATTPGDEINRTNWLATFAQNWSLDPRLLGALWFEVNEVDNAGKANWALTSPDHPPVSPASVAAFAAADGVTRGYKPLIAGLMRRDADPATAEFPPNMEVTWSQLQPNNSTELVGTEIDNALATGNRFNVRLMCGDDSPTWVKTAAGTFAYIHPQDNTSHPTMPCVWKEASLAAYENLISKLAVAYDGAISCFQVSGMMFKYAEPLIRGTIENVNSPGAAALNITNMLNNGYTEALDIAGQHRCIDAHRIFTQTRAVYAFNPHSTIQGGVGVTVPANTDALMTYARSSMGQQIILQNHSLRDSFLADMANANGGIYAQLIAHGKPWSIQGASSGIVGDQDAVMQWVAANGGMAYELSNNYLTAGVGESGHTTQAVRDATDARLKTNAQTTKVLVLDST